MTSAGMLCIAFALAAGSQSRSMAQVTLAYGLVLGIGVALVYTPSSPLAVVVRPKPLLLMKAERSRSYRASP